MANVLLVKGLERHAQRLTLEVEREQREHVLEAPIDPVAHEQIDEVAGKTAVYAPVPEPRKKDAKGNEVKSDPHQPKPDDSPAVAAWRTRMGTEDAKRIYVQRSAVAERTNADLRGHRRLDRLNVRGLAKVKPVVLLAALTFNALRMIAEGVLT